jgi:hypothetical protein
VRALASIRSSKSPGNSRRQKDGTAKGGIDEATTQLCEMDWAAARHARRCESFELLLRWTQ